MKHIVPDILGSLSIFAKEGEALVNRKLAEHGDALAQVRLGLFYEKQGDRLLVPGVEVGIAMSDANDAVKWYRKSADQGNHYGQFHLGRCYLIPLGVPKDLVIAHDWFSKAIDSAQNEMESSAARTMRDLVVRSMKPEEYARTNEHIGALREKARAGSATAQYELGCALVNWRTRNEQGYIEYAGKREFDEAEKWWRKVARQGDTRAQLNLGYMCLRGLVSYTPSVRGAVANTEEMAERQCECEERERNNENEAIGWWRMAAESGHATAQYLIALVFEERCRSQKDCSRKDLAKKVWATAGPWYQQAARAGVPDAQHWLGYQYKNGNGPAIQLEESAKWYRKAAYDGRAPAQLVLGDFYFAGAGVSKSLAEAVRWYHVAVNQGSDDAARQLGYMYAVGEGVPHDFAEAARLFRSAAEHKRWWLEYLRHYDSGDGPFPHRPWDKEDADEVMAWLCETADAGWELARKAIEIIRDGALAEAREGSKHYPSLLCLPSKCFEVNLLKDSPDFMNALMEATDSGDPNATLAQKLLVGPWPDEYWPEAPEWLCDLSEGGSTLATRLVCNYLEASYRTIDDPGRWQRVIRAVASQNDPVAQFHLGRVYEQVADSEWQLRPNDVENERGISRDSKGNIIAPEEYITAIDWYERAAKQGYARAQLRLAKIYLDERTLCAMRHDCLGHGSMNAQRIAADLLRSAANKGYAEAQFLLGDLISRSDSKIGDRTEGAAWLRRAAEQGHRNAQNDLSWRCFRGDGAPQDGAEAARWFLLWRFDQ